MNHTCLTPRGRAPYVCLHIRITRRDGRGAWVATCVECAWTETHDIAAMAADSGRIHVAGHQVRS